MKASKNLAVGAIKNTFKNAAEHRYSLKSNFYPIFSATLYTERTRAVTSTCEAYVHDTNADATTTEITNRKDSGGIWYL